MKNRVSHLLILLLCIGSFMSCNDDYLYVKEEPATMGDNIYSTLKNDGRFSTYLQILEKIDPEYIEILSRTGSRTVFVPTDDAFNEFFNNNPYGIKKVDDMSKTLMTTFINFNTLENAYVSSVLGTSAGSSTSDMIPGNCLRRHTMKSDYDTIPYTSKFPDNPQFKKYKGRSIYLMTPGSWTMVHFTQPYCSRKGMTNQDYNALYKGANRQTGDLHVFGAKVIQADITNKNGYIHVLDKVELPPVSMYEYIRDKDDISIFRKLMERFCEPRYYANATIALRNRNSSASDSVFTVSFFDTPRTITDELGNQFTVDPILFSPAANAGQGVGVGSPPNDMPVILAPTNKAMLDYLQNSYLAEYGSWDNIPDDIIAKFVNTHMKKSFLNSLPTKANDMVDDVKGDNMNLTPADIKEINVCRNGAVYTIDKVCPPRDFVTVVAPILKNSNTQVMNWLINNADNNKELKYNYFLTSLENRFTLLIPTDDNLKGYVDPVSMATTNKYKYNFKFDKKTKSVYAVRCNMNGDSIGITTDLSFIRNRLKDILEHHIIIGDLNSGATYIETKGGSPIKLTNFGGKLILQGQGNVEDNTSVTISEEFGLDNGIRNGVTCLLAGRLNYTINSPYINLMNNVKYPEFEGFYNLISAYNNPDATFFKNRKTFSTAMTNQGLTEYLPPIFFKKEGVDYNIPFLGHFNYTIFVPTSTAIAAAQAAGKFKSVDEINAMTVESEKIAQIQKNILFLKNHFIDYSIYTDAQNLPGEYTTGAKNIVSKQFYGFVIDKNNNTLLIKNNSGTVQAKTINGHTDLISRQCRFSTDGKNIASNSRIVIHLIDNVLTINE